MPTNARAKGPIQQWADRIGWSQRVRAVCKPCWELKYCPYGPLVETFPLPEERDERSCRIFGHHCPVFYVAEPLTETKELRTVSRHIPRPLQFRVLKRENQICRMCGKSVQDDDIHFDHVIPWSKGGPTEEHNIRLLCGACNRKKGAKFEDEHLVESFTDHVVEPVGFWFLEMLLWLIASTHQWRRDEKRLPTPKDMAKLVGSRKVTRYEEMLSQIAHDLESFFAGQPPEELESRVFEALRDRWGFEGGEIRRLKKVADDRTIDLADLLAAEIDLIARLGWRVKLTKADEKKWSRS